MDLNNKTLIILSPAFPQNESEEQSSWLPAQQIFIKALNKNYPELEIIVLSFQFPESKEAYYWYNNKIIPFGGGYKRRQFGRIWYKVFKTALSLRKDKNILGLISFWCSECCLVGSYFSKLYGYNHLCWISGQDAKKENKFVKRIRPKTKELVAMSDFLSDEFYKNHGIRPKYLIPDAIDTSLFPADQFERSIDILGAGSLIPLKRYDLFVEVVAAIKQQFQNVSAVLCGDGTEKQKLDDQIKGLMLEKSIKSVGLQPHKEVLMLMKKTKVFLHTSNYEGFGNVCIEALYAGAHVISFTKPMNQTIKHWHIVTTKEEMIQKAIEILNDKAADYSSILPFDMNDSAKMFIELLQ